MKNFEWEVVQESSSPRVRCALWGDEWIGIEWIQIQKIRGCGPDGKRLMEVRFYLDSGEVHAECVDLWPEADRKEVYNLLKARKLI